jgi:hypothetical protein
MLHSTFGPKTVEVAAGRRKLYTKRLIINDFFPKMPISKVGNLRVR